MSDFSYGDYERTIEKVRKEYQILKNLDSKHELLKMISFMSIGVSYNQDFMNKYGLWHDIGSKVRGYGTYYFDLKEAIKSELEKKVSVIKTELNQILEERLKKEDLLELVKAHSII